VSSPNAPYARPMPVAAAVGRACSVGDCYARDDFYQCCVIPLHYQAVLVQSFSPAVSDYQADDCLNVCLIGRHTFTHARSRLIPPRRSVKIYLIVSTVKVYQKLLQVGWNSKYYCLTFVIITQSVMNKLP